MYYNNIKCLSNYVNIHESHHYVNIYVSPSMSILNCSVPSLFPLPYWKHPEWNTENEEV